MSVKSNSFEHTKELFAETNRLDDHAWHCNLGSIEVDKDYKETETYKSVKWVMQNHTGKLKKVTWGDAVKLVKEKKIHGWNKLQSLAYAYHYFLPYGYTQKPETPKPGESGMDFMNLNDEYVDITTLLSEGAVKSMAESVYYHGAKAHWLVDSIRKEGLWNPIQGIVKQSNTGTYNLAIHPGSVRSVVFECMNDESLEMWIWDKYDLIPVDEVSIDDIIEWVKDNLKEGQYRNMSFGYTHGYIEFNTDMSNLKFRDSVYEYNKKVCELAKGKRLNIYIGYDSRHRSIAELNKKCLEANIIHGAGSGPSYNEMEKWVPEIKFLDISKIPEYTRDYANQSTEFTYSRFLIPHLENYEGFSIFLDDDILFTESILPMFYFLDIDDAVACIKYDFDKYAETKFTGEKNVSYPKKLWSSLMIFNNAHEDCKKLTPEVVNTESGKYLHQFEWTDKISEIPDWYVFTEGHDTEETNWRPSAYHYTRGGPWIEGMDTSQIEQLNIYERLLNKHTT